MAKHRSPNCPQIPFANAIERGRKVYEKEHNHPAVKLVVAQDLGYKGLSGPSLALIGALRQYGILEGSGEALRISKDALAYYEMDDGPEKAQAVQRMIFAPSLFAELRQQYGAKLPSEGNLRHTLVTKGFLPETATEVIEVYKANIELVTGEESSYSGGTQEAKSDYVAKVGDWVQWEHNGVLGFPEPKKVKGVSPDSHWAYVDGQHGAVPIKELVLESAPEHSTASAISSTQPLQQKSSRLHMQEFVVPLSNGSKAVFQWPSALSEEDKADLQDSLKIVERKILRADKSEQNLNTFGISEGVAPGS